MRWQCVEWHSRLAYVIFSLWDTIAQLEVEMLHGAARLLLEEAGSVGRDREVHLLRRRDEVKLERIEGGIQSRVGSLSSGLQFAITRNLCLLVSDCGATAGS